MNNLRRLLFFAFIFLPVQSLAYENIADYDDLEGWIEVYPPRYDTVQQFFVQQGCRFLQNVAHIYSLDDEHWLTRAKAQKSYPEISSDINTSSDIKTGKECEIQASKEELAALLQTEELGSEGMILLYFDLARDETGDHRSVMSGSMLNNYYQKLDQLSQFKEIPKYRIITSRVGFRSQIQ